MLLDTYQRLALRTEPPVTPEMKHRLAFAEDITHRFLQNVAQRASDRWQLNDEKRFIFYGKPLSTEENSQRMETPFGGYYPNEKNIGGEWPNDENTPFDLAYIRSLHALYGLLGELMDELLPRLNSGYDAKEFTDADRINIGEELGDMLWDISLMADAFSLNLADIAQANIRKLQQRYPGKFTETDAVERDLDSEQSILATTLQRPDIPAATEPVIPSLLDDSDD